MVFELKDLVKPNGYQTFWDDVVRSSNYNYGGKTDVINIDFSKAFESVPTNVHWFNSSIYASLDVH